MVDFVPVAFGMVATAGLTLAIIGSPGSRTTASSAPSPITRAVSTAAAPMAPSAAAAVSVALPAETPWPTPDPDKLPDDTWGRTVRYGRDLVVKTYALIGPEATDPAHRFSGNNMACGNCHLEAGTKKFGIPFQGVFAAFPNYRARSGKVGTIEDRIQGCMTRSMTGKPLPPEGAEMTALVAYIKFLSDGRPVGEATPGRGPGKMPEMSRPADPVHGKEVFAQNCVACHGADGLGKRVGQVGDAAGYRFPPLWGEDSFNDGAGMDRLIAAANFIHANMPNGATWQSPLLSEQDAWDVGAYVQAQPRPRKPDLDRDYPVPLERPLDNGYGPYADGFGQQQHRDGPFGPIREKIKQMQAASNAATASK